MSNKEFTHLHKEGGGKMPLLFRFIGLILATVALITACCHEPTTKAYAAETGIQQTGMLTYYEGNGVFRYWSDNKQKQYVSLHSFPPSTQYNNYVAIAYYFVNTSGVRMKWRFIGYKNGAEVFRSGLASYGEKIEINSIDIDSYDVIVVNEDENGDLQPVGDIRTAMHTWDYLYYVSQPTGEEETVPTTEYVDIQQFTGAEIPTFEINQDEDIGSAGVLRFISWIGGQWWKVFNFVRIGWVWMLSVTIAFTIYLMRGRN